MAAEDGLQEQPDELKPRQREILSVVVRAYVASAVPVGSHTILDIGGLECSSATVRNELARLEDLGYLEQPHTSAGRVPTVKGYRYYVEHLMDQIEVPVVEQRMIRHQFHQIPPALDQWLKLTAAVLASRSKSAALVTPPRATTSRFRHAELISIRDALCLLIVVLQDSSVRQEMLVTVGTIEQDRLTEVSNKLNTLLRNRTVKEIQDSTNPELTQIHGFESIVLERIVSLMQQADDRAVREVYQDGLENIIVQPEFLDVDKLRQLLELMEHRSFLERILPRILNANGVQIIIGGEGTYEEIDDVALVLSPYGIRGEASGVLGVMGPTRMPYARAISTVQYIAQLMDRLMADVYAAD
jgi:heat-inducible transcriptional repressor